MHGISSKILGDKSKDPHFLNIISDFDVVALSELHTKTNISIPGFHLKKQKFRPKNHKGPKIGGGIAVLIKQELASNFRLIPNDNVDSIWIKTSLGCGEETRLGFYYCSPDRKGSNLFEKVDDEIERFNRVRNTYIFGDFNARTKTVCENIAQDKMDETMGIQTSIEFTPPSRNSQDLKLINKRGQNFLDLCRTYDLTIANGRIIGDLHGKYTCHQKRGSSVVDYLVAPYRDLNNIQHFKIGEYTPLLSDHCPIMATIQLNQCLQIDEEKEVQLYDLPKKIQWDDNKIMSFKEALESDTFKKEVEELLSKSDGITAEEIQNLLLKVSKTETTSQDNNESSTNIPNPKNSRKPSKRQRKKDQPWFDTECKR